MQILLKYFPTLLSNDLKPKIEHDRNNYVIELGSAK